MADHYRGLAQSLVELGFLFKRQGERRREVWRNRQTNQEVTFDRDEVTRSRPAADAVLAAAQALIDNPPAAPVVETPAKPAASSKAGAAGASVKSATKTPAKSREKSPEKSVAKKAADSPTAKSKRSRVRATSRTASKSPKKSPRRK
jgi:hypothetical protein